MLPASLPCSALFELRGVRDMAFDLSMPILVVDDYNTMIRIIRNLLKQIGFENVDDASDGSAALAKMQGKKYGLVISDWNMEPMTGYDLLREVRASPELSQTPFIMITAESKTENVIAAKKAGISNWAATARPVRAGRSEFKIPSSAFSEWKPSRVVSGRTRHLHEHHDLRRGRGSTYRLLAPIQSSMSIVARTLAVTTAG